MWRFLEFLNPLLITASRIKTLEAADHVLVHCNVPKEINVFGLYSIRFSYSPTSTSD